MPDDSQNKRPEATLSEFFESKPVNEFFKITDADVQPARTRFSSPGMVTGWSRQFEPPAIRLWCSSEECDGFRTFEVDGDKDLYVSQEHPARDGFVEFVCRNCRRFTKKYAISYRYESGDKELIAAKLGEDPPLSVHIPSRLRKLVGADQDKFSKGLRSEAHGADLVWVEKPFRRCGIGKDVMHKAEQEARNRGLTGVYLWTETWQAPDFYRRLGYKQFVQFDNFPPGYKRLGFRKYL